MARGARAAHRAPPRHAAAGLICARRPRRPRPAGRCVPPAGNGARVAVLPASCFRMVFACPALPRAAVPCLVHQACPSVSWARVMAAEALPCPVTPTQPSSSTSCVAPVLPKPCPLLQAMCSHLSIPQTPPGRPHQPALAWAAACAATRPCTFRRWVPSRRSVVPMERMLACLACCCCAC